MVTRFDQHLKQAWKEYEEWIPMDGRQKAAKILGKIMKQQADIFAATHLVSDSVNEHILTVSLLETRPQFLRKQVPGDVTVADILSTVMIHTLPTASHAKGAILTQLESPLKTTETLMALGETLTEWIKHIPLPKAVG